MEIENLMSEIEEVHKINITTLGQELQTLNINIQDELVDLSKVNEVVIAFPNLMRYTKISTPESRILNPES